MKLYRVISEDYLNIETYTTYEKFFLKRENALKALEKLFKEEIEAKREYSFEFKIIENTETKKLFRNKWGNDTLIILEEINTED